MNAAEIRDIISSELRPAIGCTEPAAVALAVASARQHVPGTIESVKVIVDPNVYKNGAGVYVPGSGLTGLPIAAALGAVAGNPDLSLEVLRDVGPDDVERAKLLIAEGRVSVCVDRALHGLSIDATVVAGGHEARAVISASHTNLTRIEVDGCAVDLAERRGAADAQAAAGGRALKGLGLKTLIETVIASADELWDFLVPLAEANLAVAGEGLRGAQGLGLGANLQRLVARAQLGDDLVNACMIPTAAAADARMFGARLPVISTNGSGNQGLAVSIPVIVAAHRLSGGQARLPKALAIAQLTAIYVKQYIGKLSALCACAVASAAGSALGITYLLGCGLPEMEAAGKLVMANLTGMICDGAKLGCSLKLASSSAVSVQSALLAAGGMNISADNGIVGRDFEETIANIGRVSDPGMIETDDVILSIVEEKLDRHGC